MTDEHKVDLTIKKKKDNYYIKEDELQHITPEQAIVTLDKYTTKSRIEVIKKELDDAWERINNKIKPLGLLKKKKEIEEEESEYRG
jgi:hypothetical protein